MQREHSAPRWFRVFSPRAVRIPVFASPILLVLMLAGISSLPINAKPSQGGPVILPVADSSDIRFIHVASNQGQRRGRVGQISQDSIGFMWFATQDNVQRFDGYRLRQFQHDPANANTPGGSNSLAMYRSRSGRLWMVSDQGLDEYDPQTEKFIHLEAIRDTWNHLRGVAFSVVEDRDGVLWLSTDQGLIQFDPISGSVTVHRHHSGDPGSLSSDLIRGVFIDKDGLLWVASMGGVDTVDRKSGRVLQHIDLPKNFPHPDPFNPYLIISFCQDHAGVLWVGFSYGYGLARIDRAAGKLIFYSLDGSGRDNDLESGVRAILEDEFGALWLGTTSNGLIRLDRQRKAMVRYRNSSTDIGSLSSDQVNTLYEDVEGNIWVGTTGGWVDRFSPRRLPFHHFEHEANNPNSLETNYTSSVLEDSRGDLWVGSMRVLTRIDRKTGRYTFYRAKSGAGSLSSAWIVSMAEDHAGNLWFGTIGGGLNRYDPRTGKFKAYRHDPKNPHSLSRDTVLSLLVDAKGTIWVGTEDGLNRYDPQRDDFQVFRSEVENSNRYRSLAEDASGNLWIGSLYTGLHYLNTATGRMIVYRHSNDPQSLSNDEVHSVCVDHVGNVWVGTVTGLDQFDPESGRFKHFTVENGLPNNDVSAILEDRFGTLWISTNNGLARFEPRTSVFRNYSVADGLLGDEFYNYASAYKSPSGELFFNSYAGVISFFPEDVVDNPYVPPVVLTDFQLFSKSVPVGDGSPLRQSISATKALVLNHDQNIFSFEFSALSYANPEKNRYRYMLEGLESKWNETDSTRRFVTYTTLPPGDYIFRVQGSNNRGIWNEAGVALHIRILPAWWMTWWFRAILLVVLGTGTWLAVNMRLRTVHRRNRELAREIEDRIAAERALRKAQEELQQLNADLEERVDQRTAQLTAVNHELEAFASSVSHDLRAPLRHITGFSRMLMDEHRGQLSPDAQELLERIDRGTDRMGRLVDNLLNLSRLSRQEMKFLPVNLNTLVNEIVEDLKPDCLGREVQWKIDHLPIVKGDPTLLRQVLENLISNALKFTRPRSPAVIEIGTVEKNGARAVFVKDNGVGFDMKYSDKLFGVFQRLHRADEFPGTGVGLATVQRIVRRHGGVIWAEAELGKGASFYFTCAM